MTAISIVVAVYNSQKWLPRFFASLQNQTFKNFEVLMVDDASTDQSVALIEGVASGDQRFKLIRLPQNRGCGAACNAGILAATGETICFADPDDLLPDNSLEVRYAAYKKFHAVIRACHKEILEDGTLRNHEFRPRGLPEVFSPREVAPQTGVSPFLCAHWTWLWPTSLLQKRKILHGEDMRTGDDIYMHVQLFFQYSRVAWIDDIVYFWIKRKESLSNTIYTSDHYENYFRCCDLFYVEAKKKNQISLADDFFDQYLALYPGHLLAQISSGKSNEQDAQNVIDVMQRISERHGVLQRCMPTLKTNPARYAGLARLWGILQSQAPLAVTKLIESQIIFSRFMEERQYDAIRNNGWSRQVSFDKLDREAGLVRARYLFCDNAPEERFVSGQGVAEPAYAKNRTVHTGDGYVIFERILWLPLPPDGDERITLTVAGQDSGLNHTASQLRTAFAPRPLNDAGFPPDVRALRRLAASPAVRKKFRDAWLFIDKDCEADDNAEHLYRYVRTHHPEVNAWYVLARDSRDWPRLEAEGFRLVAHGEMEHHALYLNCAKLVSSQMDCYIFRPLEERYFTDFPEPQFVCLPHGVTKDDVSGWFNSIPFDLFVAATRDEAKSITADGTPYVMSAKEVRLGGFPRYDKWMEPVERENIVFIMPTWRADLVGEWDGKGQKRARNPHFGSSKFVRMWKELFEDPRIAELTSRYGYRVVFFAHPGFEDYLDDFHFPDFVEKRSKNHGSMINIMQRCKVMITDFSSVAYDMAYMRKPVIYYQYESKDDFTRSQRWISGYINYKTMGFGPVCRDRDALFRDLEAAMDADGVMPEPYRTRADKTFAHHDADCCRRACDFIMESSRPFASRGED